MGMIQRIVSSRIVGLRGRNGLSREILHSNKAPRHHNNNFESNKRFFETVAELRNTIFLFVNKI